MNDLRTDLASLQLDEPPPPRRRWWLAFVILFLVAGGAAVWLTRTTFAAPEVETTRAESVAASTDRSGAPILTASGYVVARRKAVVSAKIQGRLAELRVEEGSRVERGEVIARLDARDFEAQVRRARAQVQQSDAQIVSATASIARAMADLDEARRQVSVNEQLTLDDLVPTDTLDASRSQVRVLEAALGQARADATGADAARQQALADLSYAEAMLDNTVIRAPFAGVIVRKMAEVGESVAPIPPGVNLSTSSGAVVALADLDTLEVEVDVAESNVAKLTTAQPAEVTVEAFPDRRYRAELRQIIPTADRTKATVLVKVTILDTDPDLKPEMSAKATFLEPERETTAGAPEPPVLLVSAAAVVNRGGQSAVFAVEDGTARLVPVVTAGVRQDRVVIQQGLNGSETLVLNPPEELEDGDRVTTGRGR